MSLKWKFIACALVLIASNSFAQYDAENSNYTIQTLPGGKQDISEILAFIIYTAGL